MNAIHKYEQRANSVNSLICIGLDSTIQRLPAKFQQTEYPQFTFNKWIIDQTHSYVSAYKPNIAFYEARGPQGLQELKMTVDYLQENYADIFTICDAKRGDIGSSNKGYVTLIFEWYGFDAITLNPLVGKEALMPFLERDDKASIIMCRTSNPGSGEFQEAKLRKHGRLWEYIAEQVANEWNERENCMVVIGATYPDDLKQARNIIGEMTILVPGIGSQGGDPKEVTKVGLNNNGLGLILNASRSIIFSENPATAALSLRDAVNNY
jgi:orotidine-5'-phosphate decarboxylase